MKTLQEIEKAIESLPLLDRLRLYKDMPRLIGRDVEELDWQRLAIDSFFQDDSPDDQAYDQVQGRRYRLDGVSLLRSADP